MNEVEILASDDAEPADVEIDVTTPAERVDEVAASAAERDLTHALSALKRRGERVVHTVESAITPRRVAIGVSVVLGVGALMWMVSASSRRRPRSRSVAGVVAQSLVREIVGRALLGAAATAGARLAEAAIPMVIAEISARRVAAPKPARSRKRKSIVPKADVNE